MSNDKKLSGYRDMGGAFGESADLPHRASEAALSTNSLSGYPDKKPTKAELLKQAEELGILRDSPPAPDQRGEISVVEPYDNGNWVDKEMVLAIADNKDFVKMLRAFGDCSIEDNCVVPSQVAFFAVMALKPWLHKPVSVDLERCVHAIFESDKAMDSISFVNESNEAKDTRHTKAVLGAAGVPHE